MTKYQILARSFVDGILEGLVARMGIILSTIMAVWVVTIAQATQLANDKAGTLAVVFAAAVMIRWPLVGTAVIATGMTGALKIMIAAP